MIVLVVVLAVVGIAGAYLAGARRGRSQARAEFNRYLHDTVLQSLEAMAMRRSSDSADLAEFRNVARAQATALRRGLTADDDDGRLVSDLATLASDMAQEGLRAQVVAADVDDALPDARRRAMRDATREALRNALKHGGTKRVTVRVEERDGGIAVTTRDHGVGFDISAPPGFGIRESIVARLAKVGGHADISSTPGNGTRVTLWVPR